MNSDDNLQTIMKLIMYGGDAKSNAMEAIQAAKLGDFNLAKDKLKLANESLIKAHNSQTELLQKEASGDSIDMSLLLVHGQDHLMTSIAFNDLSKEIIDIYEKVFQ